VRTIVKVDAVGGEIWRVLDDSEQKVAEFYRKGDAERFVGTTVGDAGGGPAFPQQPVHLDRGHGLEWPDAWGYGGMNLRDWFAGQALPGVLGRMGHIDGSSDPAEAAHTAYLIADAMLRRGSR